MVDMSWNFLDVIVTPYSPCLSPQPYHNVHILLSEFRLLKPWASPVLSTEQPSELANILTPDEPLPHSQFGFHPPLRLLIPHAHIWHSLGIENLLWTSHPSRPWRYRTSSSISSPRLGFSTLRDTWHLGFLLLSSLSGSPLKPLLTSELQPWPAQQPHVHSDIPLLLKLHSEHTRSVKSFISSTQCPIFQFTQYLYKYFIFLEIYLFLF